MYLRLQANNKKFAYSKYCFLYRRIFFLNELLMFSFNSMDKEFEKKKSLFIFGFSVVLRIQFKNFMQIFTQIVSNFRKLYTGQEKCMHTAHKYSKLKGRSKI